MNQYNSISIRNILRPVKVRAEKRHDNHHIETKADSARGRGGKKMRSSHSECLQTNDRMHIARSHAHNLTIDRGFKTMKRR